MNTVGFTGILNDEIAVFVNPSRVTLGNGVTFGCVMVSLSVPSLHFGAHSCPRYMLVCTVACLCL
jgi:hypothetical protein